MEENELNPSLDSHSLDSTLSLIQNSNSIGEIPTAISQKSKNKSFDFSKLQNSNERSSNETKPTKQTPEKVNEITVLSTQSSNSKKSKSNSNRKKNKANQKTIFLDFYGKQEREWKREHPEKPFPQFLRLYKRKIVFNNKRGLIKKFL